MRIENADISLSSQHTRLDIHNRQESLTITPNSREGRVAPSDLSSAGLERLFQDLVRISQAGRSLAPQPSRLEARSELTDEQTLELAVVKALLERLLGSEVHLVDPAEFVARLQSHGMEDISLQQRPAGSGPAGVSLAV